MAYECGYEDGYTDDCELSPTPPTSGVCFVAGYAGGVFGVSSVYAGSLFCDVESPAPATPQSNVLNIDETRGRLGCGTPSFFITSRCAGPVAVVLDGLVSNAKWDRKLDDVSSAEVEIDLGGDASFACCRSLSEVEPWCHELHIWRDNEEVWVGPIQEIEYSYSKITVRAKDSLAWLGVRIPPGNINFRAAPDGPGAADLTTIGLNILTVAFGEDSPTHTCELDNVYSVLTGRVEQRFWEGFNQTSLEILRDLAESGLDFTTLGRTIVLVGDTTSLTPLILLNDEHIMGDIVVVKDGTLLGNRFYVHFEGDGGIPAESLERPHYCYGAIERVVDGLGLSSGVDAAVVADAFAEASSVAPKTIEIPAGSRLSPDTPWTINQMVPGARVDVAITRFCLDLTQSFQLTSVEVSYNEGEGESVGITLTPINQTPIA